MVSFVSTMLSLMVLRVGFLMFFYVEALGCQNLLSRSQKFNINTDDQDEMKTLWVSRGDKYECTRLLTRQIKASVFDNSGVRLRTAPLNIKSEDDKFLNNQFKI